MKMWMNSTGATGPATTQCLNQKWPAKVISGDTSWDEVMRVASATLGTKHELSLSRHDPGWSKIAGIIDANDERQARLRLREEGLFCWIFAPKKVRE